MISVQNFAAVVLAVLLQNGEGKVRSVVWRFILEVSAECSIVLSFSEKKQPSVPETLLKKRKSLQKLREARSKSRELAQKVRPCISVRYVSRLYSFLLTQSWIGPFLQYFLGKMSTESSCDGEGLNAHEGS